MNFIISYLLRYVFQTWLISRLAKYIRNVIVRKYKLDEHFVQSVEHSSEIDWANIRWFAVFAAYAYKKSDDVIRKKYEIFSDIYIHEINQVKYIVLKDEANKNYYISIRGTINSHNALQDINFFKDKSFRLGIYLHTGFHRTAELIADDLLNRLDRTYSIYITGHSLGAAQAVIVAWYLDYSNFNISECITFGQPKITDSIGTRVMRGKIKLTRIVNETDIVSMVPPAGTHRNRYAHLGTMIKLLEKGKYCYLEEPDSLNYGVNSFWLFAAEESLSFYEIGKELPDHYMTSYISNIDSIIEEGKEILWKDRMMYLSDNSLYGELKRVTEMEIE
jgi:triacylglycerol lipase